MGRYSNIIITQCVVHQMSVYGVCVFTFVGVVAFICHHFGGNAPRDVVSALHREVVPRRQSNSFPASIQQLSEAIQKVVKERRMTWFQFARYLLRSETTRPFVFKIVQYIRGKLWMGFVYTSVALL